MGKMNEKVLADADAYMEGYFDGAENQRNIVNEIATWNYVRDNTTFDRELEIFMILDELREFKESTTLVNDARELADIIFVAIGSLYKLVGTSDKAEAIIGAVIDANVRKGTVKDGIGKIIKPADFVGPQGTIETILEDRPTLWDSYLNDNPHIYKGV